MAIGLYYKLHIQKCYGVLAALTPEQLAKLWNGVGSDRPVAKWFKPPRRIRNLFAEASKFHDVACAIGGSEEHRIVVDREFTQQCLIKVYDQSWYQMLLDYWWVRADDVILKNFGALGFTYREAPCYDIERLITETETQWK